MNSNSATGGNEQNLFIISTKIVSDYYGPFL